MSVGIPVASVTHDTRGPRRAVPHDTGGPRRAAPSFMTITPAAQDPVWRVNNHELLRDLGRVYERARSRTMTPAYHLRELRRERHGTSLSERFTSRERALSRNELMLFYDMGLHSAEEYANRPLRDNLPSNFGSRQRLWTLSGIYERSRRLWQNEPEIELDSIGEPLTLQERGSDVPLASKYLAYHVGRVSQGMRNRDLFQGTDRPTHGQEQSFVQSRYTAGDNAVRGRPTRNNIPVRGRSSHADTWRRRPQVDVPSQQMRV